MEGIFSHWDIPLTLNCLKNNEHFYDFYGDGVLDGTGVIVGRNVGLGGTVFVGVGEGSAVGVMISSAR